MRRQSLPRCQRVLRPGPIHRAAIRGRYELANMAVRDR
jgi:hypothetical protein